MHSPLFTVQEEIQELAAAFQDWTQEEWDGTVFEGREGGEEFSSII